MSKLAATGAGTGSGKPVLERGKPDSKGKDSALRIARVSDRKIGGREAGTSIRLGRVKSKTGKTVVSPYGAG
jgi:hypothetical protein